MHDLTRAMPIICFFLKWPSDSSKTGVIIVTRLTLSVVLSEHHKGNRYRDSGIRDPLVPTVEWWRILIFVSVCQTDFGQTEEERFQYPQDNFNEHDTSIDSETIPKKIWRCSKSIPKEVVAVSKPIRKTC